MTDLRGKGTIVYSALSVVALYHDSIVQGRIDRLDRLPRSPFPQITPYTLGSDSITGKDGRNDDRMSGSASGSKMDTSFTPIPPLSDHARYTRHFCKTSKTYSRAGRLLMFIQHTQLLLEMIVRKRKGNEKRWEVLCWLEGIK
jgi:peroxin-16